MLALTVLGAGTWLLVRRDRPAREPVVLADAPELDPELEKLVGERVARVRAQPGDARAHGDLALVYEANELWAEAAASYANAAALDPSDASWRYRRAVALQETGDPALALALLRDAARELRALAAPQYLLGISLVAEGDFDGAEASLRAAKALAKDDVHPDVGLARVAIERGDFARARALLEAALARAPRYGHAHYLLGLALRGLGDETGAARELALGLDSRPEPMRDPFSDRLDRYAASYVVQVDRALQWLAAGSPPRAIEILEKVAAKRPDDVQILNNLAGAHLEAGHYDKVLAILARAIELEPDGFAAYINLSIACRNLGRTDEALRHADRAVAIAPSVARAHFVRAEALLARRDLQSAFAALRRSVLLDARDARAWAALGEISALLGNTDLAIEHFRSAVGVDPANLPAQVSLGALLIQAGRLDEAEPVVHAAERLAPEHPRVLSLRQRLGREAP